MLKEFDFILKEKKFKFLWISQILSQLTINMMTFLLLIYLYSKTESTIAASFIWVSYSIPALLVGPFGAAFSDMLNRKKILLTTNLLQSLVIFAYAFFYKKYLFSNTVSKKISAAGLTLVFGGEDSSDFGFGIITAGAAGLS